MIPSENNHIPSDTVLLVITRLFRLARFVESESHALSDEVMFQRMIEVKECMESAAITWLHEVKELLLLEPGNFSLKRIASSPETKFAESVILTNLNKTLEHLESLPLDYHYWRLAGSIPSIEEILHAYQKYKNDRQVEITPLCAQPESSLRSIIRLELEKACL